MVGILWNILGILGYYPNTGSVWIQWIETVMFYFPTVTNMFGQPPTYRHPHAKYEEILRPQIHTLQQPLTLVAQCLLREYSLPRSFI